MHAQNIANFKESGLGSIFISESCSLHQLPIIRGSDCKYSINSQGLNAVFTQETYTIESRKLGHWEIRLVVRISCPPWI